MLPAHREAITLSEVDTSCRMKIQIEEIVDHKDEYPKLKKTSQHNYPKAQSVLIVELSQQASIKYISDFTGKKTNDKNAVWKELLKNLISEFREVKYQSMMLSDFWVLQGCYLAQEGAGCQSHLTDSW